MILQSNETTSLLAQADDLTIVTALVVAIVYFYKENKSLKDEISLIKKDLANLRENLGYYRGQSELVDTIKQEIKQILEIVEDQKETLDKSPDQH